MSYVLAVDATVRYLSEEHLPFAFFAFLIFLSLLLPPLLLILCPCKVFSRCLNCCCRRRWHALHTFVEAFQGCYKNGVSEGWDFRSMSGVYMLLRYALLLVNYRMVPQIGWLLRALMFLSLSTLILAVQPYKKRYMNVIDGLLLALLGVLSLLLITLEYLLPSASETLPLIILIACGLPQLVLVLSVTCRQLKGKQMAQYIAGKISTLLKQVHKQKQGNELSVADSLPHRLVNPNQYNRSLPTDTEQASNNSETLTVRRQVSPVYNYGSVN